MKLELLCKGTLGALLVFGGMVPVMGQEVEGPNEKATRYHSLLLKKPGNAMVFSRFVDAWLDTGSKKGLTTWLETEAKAGEASDWRVLGALHQYMGEDEAALKALNEAVDRDGENADLRLSRAKMQARLLAFEAALVDLEIAAKDEKVAIEASKLKGIYLARSGQVDEAVKAWKEVIAAYPKDEDLREDLIEVEVMEGLYKDAIEASTGLVKMTKDPYKKTLRRLRLGDIQILAGDRDAGLKTYEEIMAATGEGTWLEREVLAQVERVFLKEDDIKGLRDFYQKLREEHPRRVSIRKVLARQMALNDEMKEAIALFREVLKITPGDLRNREEFIAFLEANEKWKEAKEELVALLEQRKEDALLWERLSRIEAKLNDQDALKAALAKVAELKKGTAEGLLATAALYEQAKLMEGAEALLREGQTAFPDSLEVSEGLASFLVQNKKEEEALGIWKAMAKGADREGLLRVARSLNSHGKGDVAFGILGERVGEFENDPLILTQYCKLASSIEEASQAIPQGLALVNQSTTPTELEGAVQTALRLIARAEKREDVQKTLVGQADLGVAGQCLLSAIYEDQGDSIKASEILTKAAALPDGSLARFYRVRFEEQRGNIEEAIVVMRGIIETPEGRKTVHLRRLVDLLERSGDYEKALAAVGDWKRIAPGDHSAWKRRAKLLQANAQPEEAVVELRRMIGKFGADEERRAELAAALIEAAEYTPAQRIYEQLYSESEKLETKLKWAGEMAQLAEKEGKLEELLEDFDRRKRSNPRSVAPLLAIAEIHRVLDQYEERRSALLEASRRRPEDTQLLARIAEVEERAGEFDRAVEILRDAVKRDKTFESKRLLASLLLKNGEVQSGLDMLGEIPETVNDPRGLERVVQALMRAQETEQAMKFLQKYLGKHEADWRLQYLNAMVLKLAGEHAKALEVFTSLLKGGDEISGLKPLVSKQNANQNLGPLKAILGANGWAELTPYQQYLRMRNSSRQGQGRGPRIPLPGTPREVQLLSLLQGSSLLSEVSEKDLPAARKALSLPGIKDVDIITALVSRGGADGLSLLEKRAKENPDDLGLFALSFAYKGSSVGITLEEFEKAEKILLEKHPAVFAMISFVALQRSEVTAERIAAALVKAMESLPQDEADEMMQLLSYVTFSPYASPRNGGKDMAPIKTLMAERALATAEMPKNWRWMPVVVPHLLVENRMDDGLTLINRLCEWQTADKNPAVAGGMMAMMPSPRRSSRNAYLLPPTFPPESLKGVPSELLSLFPVKSQKSPEVDPKDTRAKLLARLDLDEEEEGPTPIPKLGEKAAGIESPALRALAFLSMGQEEDAQKLIEAMLGSREESSLLFAAGYLHDRGDPRAYEALLTARMLPLSRDLRKRVDGHLALVGSVLADKEGHEFDLEPAKRAALRLRRVLGVNEREKLGEVLIKLGLENEAERLAAAPKPAASTARSGMSSSRNQKNRITELKKAGNIDGAAREAAKQFRALANGRNNNWELRELKAALSTKELKEETLKNLDPGESKSTKRLLEFAKAQELLGTKEKAREFYEKVLLNDPDHTEARVGSLKTTPFAEIDQSRIVIRKDDKIDVDATGLIFDNLWEDSSSGQNLDRYVGLCKLTESFLETLPPSGKAKHNLSWVPYHILSFAGNTYLGGKQLDSLISYSQGFVGGNRDTDKEATKMRNDAVKAVFLAMIKHPQIAEQGFMLLESGREGLGLEDDDLVKYARAAVAQVAERSGAENRGLWSKYYGNGSGTSGELEIARGPMTWLVAHAAKTNTEMFTPELLEKIRKAQPERFALLDQARALAKAEPDESEKLYATWKETLPEIKREKAIDFAKQVLLFSPKAGPWAGDLEALILDSTGSSNSSRYISGEREWGTIVREWGSWRYRTVGSEKYEAFLLALFESSFGPSDKWEVLAQLGENALPQKYQRSGFTFKSVLKALLSDPDLVKPTLIFIAKHPLGKFIEDLDRVVKRAWSPIYAPADLALKTMVRNGLLTTNAEMESPSLEHFLMVANSLHGIRLRDGSKGKEKLADSIMKEKDLQPLLQNVAAASLLSASKGRKLILPLLEKDLEFVKALVKEQPKRSFEVFGRWFPRMEKEEMSEPLRAVFASFAVDARAKKLEVMRAWVKDGVPGISKRDDDDFWKEGVALILLDEQLGQELVSRVLNDVRLAKNLRSFSIGRVTLSIQDYWFQSLLDLLQSGKSQLDLPQQVRLIDSVYRGESGAFVLEPTAVGGSNYEWAWDLFKTAHKKPFKEGEQAPLFSWLKELNPGQQASLTVLWSDGILGASDDDFKRLKKHEEALTESSPILAEFLKMASNYRVWKKGKDGKALNRARLNYVKLLASEDLLIPLKVDLLARVMRRAPALHSGAEVFEEISKIMADYGATERNHAASSLKETVEGLAKLSFVAPPEVGGAVAEQAERLLLSKEAMGARRNRTIPEVSESIVKLALKADRIELASGILRKDYAAYRGNLEVMLSLSQAGEFKTMNKLVSAKAGRYSAAGLGFYDQEFHELMLKTLKEIPEEDRYHLEVVLSDRKDPAKGKGTPHHTPRGPRMESLAKVFAEKGTNLKGDARLEVLAIFAYHGASTPILENEMRDVFDRLSLADSFVFDKRSRELERSDGFEILKRVIHMNMMAGNFEPVRQKVEDFQQLLETDANNVWQLRRQLDEVFGLIGQELIQAAAEDPEAVIGEAKAFFDLAMKVSSETSPLYSLDGASLIVHALAGKDGEWKSYLENHPEKKRYQQAMKARYRNEQFKDLVSDSWLRSEMAEVRAKVLRALLDSSFYKERDLKYINDYYGLTGSKLFTVRELIDEVDALPKDHPRKAEAMFHTACLKTFKLKGRTVEGGIVAYSEALKLAQDSGDEKLANQILAHRCDIYFRNNMKEEAKRDAPRIKVDQLPKKDQKWIKKALLKWQKE